MSELKIRDISLFSLLAIVIGITLSSIILYVSLNKIKSLNNQLKVFTNTKNSFLELKLNTEEILTTKDLDATIKKWNSSITKFENDFKHLESEQKQSLENPWYISKKEIVDINKILNNKLLIPQNLDEKSILFIQGQMFTLEDKSEIYFVISSLIKKLEFLFQYERIIFDELEQIDGNFNSYIEKQIDITTYYSIFFILLITLATIFVIVIMDRKVVKIESQLLSVQKNLRASLVDLKDSRVLLQNIIDSTPAAIFWKDKNNRYLGVNKLFLENVNIKEYSEIIGKTDFEMPWSKTEASKFTKDDNEIMNTKTPKINIEETLTNYKGELIKLLTSKVPLQNANGEIIGILGIYIDITEKERITEELFKKDKLLAQSSKMAAMGEMLENIAHQWRQPLSCILTSATGMKLKNEFDHLDKEFLIESLDGIENSVKHLNRTIDDFRNFYKEDKQKKLFSTNEVFEKAISLIEAKLKNKSIDIIINSFDSKIYGFENEFIQVLMNILNNSIDEFIKITQEKKLIFINVNNEETCGNKVSENIVNQPCTKIEIYDNAGGIPENILEKVFDAYFTTKENEQGTGIGLYMSKQIIEKNMQGSISIQNKVFEYESKQYTGAEFTILLPSNECLINDIKIH